MDETTMDVIDNLIQAISILNKTDEYLEGLVDGLSKCDSLTTDFEHFIENTPIEEVNLERLYINMQNNFKSRRIIKDDITLKDNYNNLTARLNNKTNREFLIQNMKNVKSKIGIKYSNRILKAEDIQKLKEKVILEIKTGRGRPRKKEIENV